MNFSKLMNAVVKSVSPLLLGCYLIVGGVTAPIPVNINTEAEEPPTFIEIKQELDPEPEPDPEPEMEAKPEETEPEMELLGHYRITGYCGCVICCGKWAHNRPNGIVYGASGAELKHGISIASTLPYGTQLYIDGLGTYTVEDRAAGWVVDKYDGKILDIYFNTHDAARELALQHRDVYLIKEDKGNE